MRGGFGGGMGGMGGMSGGRRTLFKKESLDESEAKLREKHLSKLSKAEIIKQSVIFAKKNWRHGAFQQVYNLIQKFFAMYLPIQNGKMVDAITKKGDYNELFASFESYMIILFIRLLFSEATQVFAYFFVSNTNEEYKSLVIENVAEKDITFFDLFKTGELIQRIKDSELILDNNFIFKTINFLQYLGQFILMAYLLMQYSVSLTFIYLIVFSLKFICDYLMTKYSSHLNFRDRREVMDKYSGSLNEFLSNIKTIKSFGTEYKEIEKMKEIKRKMKLDYLSFWNLFVRIIDFVNSSGEIIVLFVAGYKTINNELTYGDLVIFQQYTHQLRSSFKSMQTLFNEYWDMFEGWSRFFEIYNYEPKIVSKKNLQPESFKGEIEFDSVSFAYPLASNVRILNDLSFKIKPGQVIAIVGHSGCGKSTISNLVQRFYDPTEGRIVFDGNDLRDLSIPWLRNKIGFVAQEPVLQSGTIEENITYGVDSYTQEELDKVCQLANIHKFVNDKALFPKGFKTLVGERGAKVSGGQKQRIAIARAVMKNSKILVCDEATSALDAESENDVQTAIDNIIKIKQITTIIIAHRLCTIKNADLILFLNKGTIIEQGNHKELIEKDGEYKKLIQRQLVE